MNQRPLNTPSGPTPGGRPPVPPPPRTGTVPLSSPLQSQTRVASPVMAQKPPSSTPVQQGSMNNAPYYKKVVESIDQLPSLPAIVTKLIQVVNSPESSADDAAKLIEKDPGLTSKMIRLANSAFYGIPRSISSVSSAVVILGFNTIRSLVLSASVMKMFAGSQQPAIDKEKFWRHSITTAMAAKLIVRHFINVRMMDPESAFCAGILHDIGKLIFNEYMSKEYVEVTAFAEKNNMSLLDVETKVLGINHAAIGKVISDKWALPLDLEYTLVYHHEPGAADQLNELVATINYADLLAHEAGASLWENEPVYVAKNNYRSVLNVSDNDHERILQMLIDSLDKSNEFISIIK
jgi:putative nucleotidyltransferase with HDIG domain